MSEEADILSVSQFQLAPAILQGQTKAKMVTMVSALQDLIGRLTSLRMQHLFMIMASPRSGFPLVVGLFKGMLQGPAISGSPDSFFFYKCIFFLPSFLPSSLPFFLLSVLGLHCCARAFSSGGKQGLLIAVASRVVEHGL